MKPPFHYRFYLFLAGLCLASFWALGQEISISPSRDSIPTINEDYNVIQYYKPEALRGFWRTWNDKKGKKVIAMLGDSHLQSEIYPNAFRKVLQAEKGDGGKGIMFNYSAANTYSSVLYKTKYTGKWESSKSRFRNPKLPLGLSGMTLKTTDSHATLSFKFNQPVPENWTVLKLFVDKNEQSFDCKISSAGRTTFISVPDSDRGKPYITLNAPFDQEIKINLQRTTSQRHFFEFYGFSLESNSDTGVIVHSAGVGAAQYNSILSEKLFVSQLASVEANLVVIDFGTNDFLYDDSIKTKLDPDIRKVIALVREARPEASIILTTTTDMKYRGKALVSEGKFKNLIYSIAEEENCAIYDWFSVTGGEGAIDILKEQKLAQPDNIHLTFKGYTLKGKLLSQALLKSLAYLSSESSKPLLVKPK